MRDLPTGTVTFLFTDIEGSTRLLHELGAEGYAAALAEHRRVLREAFGRHGGVEVDTQGDAFFVAFPTAPGALAAAAEATEALAAGRVRVRMGLHTGAPFVAEEGYVGADVHRAARIAAAAHGGQVLISAAAAALVSGNGLRDLGEHRFKDLSAPERVYQLGDGGFPPLKTLYRTNLPVPATSFVGRAREVDTVARLIADPDVRLVTLTGPGGTGKTRLALQAAAEAAESFPDGLTWLALAPLDDAALVIPALAAALEVADQLSAPGADALARALAGKRVGLVLDNAEHLLPALADELAHFLEVPGPTLIVTSRERLDLPGEHVVPVDPLADVDAVNLFTERARALGAEPGDRETVAALCRRLDNLPLAMELAAARSTLFTPAQLLERLAGRLDLLKGGRRADPRHQTLRATIEWSHDLLTNDEQQLFRRLAVFTGGCTYEAAEAVCEADPDVLQSLLDKSLIRRRDAASGTRLWMLETIREFAGERLASSGERATVADAHARWFGSFAPARARRVRAYEPVAVAEMMDELPNVRAALAFALERGEVALAGDLLFGASFVWLTQGYGREANEAAERWLALDAAGVAQTARLPGLLAASEILRFAGDARRAAQINRQQAEMIRADPSGEIFGWPFRPLLAACLTDLATLELDWDVDAAAEAAAEALEIRREIGEPGGIGHALAGVAVVAFAREAFEDSRTALAESVDLWSTSGYDAEVPGAQAMIAECCLHLGRHREAAQLLRDAVRGARAGSDLPQLLFTLRIAGLHAAVGGRLDVAGALVEATDRAVEDGGVRLRNDRESELEDALLAPAQTSDPAAWRAGCEHGRALDVDGAHQLALEYLCAV